jgi:HSP20 family molecular chaperone IbpA
VAISHIAFSPENTMTPATTTIVRHPLFNEFERLLGEVDLYRRPEPRKPSLNCHVDSKDNEAIIEVEVPGVDPSDVKVKIEGRSLSVETPKGDTYVTIGQRLDADSAVANLKHGLLTVKVPKREAKVVEVSVSEI